jgi:hypothetical protein
MKATDRHEGKRRIRIKGKEWTKDEVFFCGKV